MHAFFTFFKKTTDTHTQHETTGKEGKTTQRLRAKGAQTRASHARATPALERAGCDRDVLARLLDVQSNAIYSDSYRNKAGAVQ